MGVFFRSPNFAQISDTMSAVANNWMNAEVSIVDPNLDILVWDEWTNEYISNDETVLWSGKARVQPINMAYSGDAGMSTVATRRVRIQIPKSETRGFIRAGLQIRVTNGGEFPEMESLQFIIREAVSSSYSWLVAVECDVDVKSEMDTGS